MGDLGHSLPFYVYPTVKGCCEHKIKEGKTMYILLNSVEEWHDKKCTKVMKKKRKSPLMLLFSVAKCSP